MTPSLSRAAVLLAALVVVIPSARSQPDLPPPDGKQDTKQEQPEPGIKVADKGPIHEAFAQPGAQVRGQGMTAPKAPPPPIPELPPESKPDGANVKWVPGYWQWDADKNDFIWVSGFYRNVPPGREWQAGQWAEKDGKWVYTPGFWRPTNMNSWRTDLPEPPKSVEGGPSTPSGNPDAIWVPGGWEFRNGQYVWRAGYWAHPNGNMMWQPGQYLVTGSGYSYAPGYWDYSLEDRGLLYAPVYFTDPLWLNPGWAYTPRYAIGLGYGGYGGLYDSLFIGAGYNNYYYGNYWNPWGFGIGGFWGPWGFGLGLGLGFGFGGWGGCHPWWFTGHGFCNPLWNHSCWLNRTNPRWASSVQAAHVARTFGAAPRPTAAVPNTVTVPRVTAGGAAAAGGAAQLGARSAAATAAARPAFVQPASQVLAAQTARATALTSTATPRTAGLGTPNLPNVRAAGGASVVGNSMQLGNPLHAGASIAAGGALAQDRQGVSIRSGNAVADPGVHFSPSQSAPAIRSGQDLGSQIRNPATNGGAPQIHYSGGQSLPSVRSMPSAPAFNPGSFGVGGSRGGGFSAPSMHYGGGGFGGGGGVRMGGGGGHVGGGGGHGGHR